MMLFSGIGLFISTIPHYIIDKYEPPSGENILCGIPSFLAPPMNVSNSTGGGMPTPCVDEVAERYVLLVHVID